MQQWFKQVKEQLAKIEENYADGSAHEREQYREQIICIRQSCEQFMESWIEIEERIADMADQYPDLITLEEGGEGSDWQEEFWLQETAVRQFRQGQGYYDLTMFQEAQKHFQEVLMEEPDFLLGRIYYGLSLFQNSRWEEAVQQFQLIVSTTDQIPFLSYAYLMLGCSWVRMGKERQAVRAFTQCLELDSDQADAWFNLGTCYYRLQDYTEAIPCFYRALAIDEQDWESMFYLSNCYRHVGQWSRVSYWRFATYEKIQHPQVIQSIAQDYEEMGSPNKAIEWYQKLFAHQDYQTIAYQGMSWNHWKLSQHDRARLWIKKGLSIYPRDPDLLFTYVWIHLAEGDMEAVKKVMTQLPEYLKDQPLWWAVSSRIFMRLGDLQGAIDMAEQLIQLPKGSLQALGYHQKGLAMLEMGDTEEAIQHFQQARANRGQWKDPLFYEGVCHMMDGRPELTTQCWEQIGKG